jgi:site-specific recombinase XerD
MTKENLKEKKKEFIKMLKLEELAQKTLVSYENAIDKFIDFVDNDFTLSKSLMIDWKHSLIEKYSIKSRNQYIVVINKFLKFLGYGDSENKDKDYRIKQFKEQSKSVLEEQIEIQEHKRMLRWAKKMNMMDMFYIIQIFAHVGARIEELKYFTVENLDSNYIKGAYNKGKERVLIMTNELKRDLKHYCKDHKIKSGYIFISPVNENQMLNNSTIWRRLKKIARSAKINPKKIHPHAWRHLFAKQCKENGIDLDELADILGHKDINTTAIYTKTSMKEKKNKLERIRY